MLQVLYSPGSDRVRTELKDGRCRYTGKSAAEIMAEDESLQVMSWEEVEPLLDEAWQKKYCSEPEQITEERFDEMLNILPPCRWVRGYGVESFYLSERLAGNIVSIFCRIGKTYWSFNAPASVGHDEIVRRCQAALEAKSDG